MPIDVICSACGTKLRAPDALAGQEARCPTCRGILAVPDDVVDAEEVVAAPARPLQPDEEGVQPAPRGGADRQPCPLCGEMIVFGAAKCRFCGEIFDPTLRRLEAKHHTAADSDLTPGDWAVCILCMNIGCIVGLVYAIQGKPKGMKMVGINLAFQFLLGMILGIVSAILEHR